MEVVYDLVEKVQGIWIAIGGSALFSLFTTLLLNSRRLKDNLKLIKTTSSDRDEITLRIDKKETRDNEVIKFLLEDKLEAYKEVLTTITDPERIAVYEDKIARTQMELDKYLWKDFYIL